MPGNEKKASCFTEDPLRAEISLLKTFLSILKPVLGRRLIAASLSLAAPTLLFAHDIITTKLTYTRDISRIFAKRCVACHSPAAAIPLTTYQEVRPWAVDIKQQVLSRQMPPWGAVKGFGEFAPDDGLSQEELLIISAWVLGGAPEGDPKLLPSSPAKPPQSSPELPLRNVVIVDTQNTLDQSIALAAIKPLPGAPVASSRVTASFPDGHIEPLLWLSQYDDKWNRTFRLRQPILLPAGTVIHADSPLRFALQAKQ
jgi:mono/diheme cytochrome c family protein